MEINTTIGITKNLKNQRSYYGVSLSDYANKRWVAINDITQRLDKEIIWLEDNKPDNWQGLKKILSDIKMELGDEKG